jgi:hypothetical protein
MNTKITIFWGATLCSLVERYQMISGEPAACTFMAWGTIFFWNVVTSLPNYTVIPHRLIYILSSTQHYFCTQDFPQEIGGSNSHSAGLNGDSTCSSGALKFPHKTYRSFLILSSNLCSGLPRSLFPSSYPATILNALLIRVHLMHAT